ncbi:hypothetical protein V6N12_047689 [Hibiscus sabdariffa]|uniref:Uncharacterized protein n=1 Tax=Hibiscus sabdariffa TaxID=183260 RepID=A0ABR2CTP3_9ROSI
MMPRQKAGPDASVKKTDAWIPGSTRSPQTYILKDRVCYWLLDMLKFYWLPVTSHVKSFSSLGIPRLTCQLMHVCCACLNCNSNSNLHKGICRIVYVQ